MKLSTQKREQKTPVNKTNHQTSATINYYLPELKKTSIRELSKKIRMTINEQC